jgi:hypothetical protein
MAIQIQADGKVTMQSPDIETGIPAWVKARIKYVVAGEKAVFYPTDREKSYWPGEEHAVPVENMRLHADSLSLEKNGFVLLHEPTSVSDFNDSRVVQSVYFTEIIELVKRLNGTEKVIVFGDVVRSDAPGSSDGALPAYGAHIDYGDRSVRAFAEDVLGKQEAARWLRGRYVLMNLWRPITPVYRSPLALCDAASVSPGDLNDSEVRGGLMDRERPSLFGYNLSFNPRHRWFYAPLMQPDEVLAFKLFDSDSSRVQWTGHTAFDDPSTKPDAPPRESIEVRTISFFPEA